MEEAKALSELISEAVALKRGNKEFVLYYWPTGDRTDGSGSPSWSAYIGNPSEHVALLEASPDFSAEAATPEEAVSQLIEILRAKQSASDQSK